MNDARPEHGSVMPPRLRGGDALGAYLRALNSLPVLSAEHEHALAMDMLQARRELDTVGTARARLTAACSQLLRANLRLVVSIARRYRNRGVDMADLIQEGNIGLMRAIERFDPRRNVRFSTYAAWWIRQRMGKALLDQGRTIRIPTHVATAVHELAMASHDLLGRLGHVPAPAEIAEQLRRPVDHVRRMLTLPRTSPLVDAPAAGGHHLETSRAGTEAPGGGANAPPDAILQSASTRAITQLALAALTPREREILALRFGMDGRPPRSMRAVARQCGISRETLQRIETRALRKLRHDHELRGLLEE